jgi:hypothetical protein
MENVDAKLFELEAQGLLVAEQAKVLGMAKEAVQKARKRLGIVTVPPPISDEEREFMTTLIQEGVSYLKVSQAVAEKFGVQRSKNAVAGFAFRNVVRSPRTREEIYAENSREKIEENKSKPKKRPPTAGKFLFNTDPALKTAPDDLAMYADAFAGTGKELDALGNGECRWPLERVNGVYTFCGCRVHRKSYCEAHFKRAYPKE